MKNTKTNTAWRDRKGNFHEIKNMDTPYLYNTVKMLWNNVVGRHNPFGDVICWDFDEVNYQYSYLIDIYAFGFIELENRKDNQIAGKFIKHVYSDLKDIDRAFEIEKQASLKSLKRDTFVNPADGDFLDQEWGNN